MGKWDLVTGETVKTWSIYLYIHIYIYLYLIIFIYLIRYRYMYSITDMCCCQLAAAVAHLLPVLNSSCLCFVALKQGPDSGHKNGTTILKVVAQLPNLWTQFWAYGKCVWPSAKSALSCDRLHLSFMFSCAWCQDAGFTVYI